MIVDSVIDHIIDISKYNPLAGSSNIKLPKELNHPRNGLIDIQNFYDNKCFKWCLVRYLHPADYHPRRIRKIDKLFGDEVVFEDIKFPVKIKDIYKVFLVMKTTKNILRMTQKKCFEDKHVDL